MTEKDYLQSLRQLLPPGPAFDLELQPDIARLLSSLAPELARVDQALDDLVPEMNPATVSALLTDWEDYLGLPDICTVPGSQSMEQRRQAVLDKLVASGAPQRAYYLRVANRAGVPVTLTEFRPARCGPTNTGDFVYGAGWPWSWLANAPVDAFGTVEAATLNCRLQLEAPEYTDVVLGFGGELVSRITGSADELFGNINYITPAAVAGIGDL